MDRRLIDYIPPEFQKYEELKAIFATEQVDIVNYWDNGIKTVFDNQFIESLTDYGCKKWEKMIDIQPMGDDTLEERRFRILAYLNAQLPYTYRQLQLILANLCGNNGFVTYLRNNEYNLIVKLALSNEKNYNTVVKMLRSVVPANLTINVYMFNTHRVLGRFTHRYLHDHTQYGCRTDLLEE